MMLNCWGKPMRLKLSKLEKLNYARKKAKEDEAQYVTEAELVKRDAEKCREHVRNERKRLGLE